MPTDNYLASEAYQGTGNDGFHTFEQNGAFYFGFVHEGKVVLRSEGYSSASSRDNGIKSVTKNASEEMRWKTLEEGEKHIYILRAGNNQEIARSAEYETKSKMLLSLGKVWGSATPIKSDAIAATTTTAEAAAPVETPEPVAVETTAAVETTPVEEVAVAAAAPAVVAAAATPAEKEVKEEAPEVAEAAIETPEVQKVVETEVVSESAPVGETATTDEADTVVVYQEPEVKSRVTKVIEEDVVEEEEEELILPEETVVASGAHDDFDWENTTKHSLPYSESQIKDYQEQYESTLSAVIENEIVSGIVSTINDRDVVLDINFKSDGLVSISEFRDLPDLKVGDPVEVYVEKQEDDRGQLILSRKKAKLLRSWEGIKDSHANGTVIKGTVISKTKGGLIVDCSGLETFLPGSQIDIKPIVDYDSYVGKTMEFKVVKINETIKNAVVSHKALIESDLAEQREAIIASLEKGQVLEGIVKNITDFGAFLDLGGVDGLLLSLIHI